MNDKDLFSLSEKERGRYRTNEIGFVFQSYHLLPYLSVFEKSVLTYTKIKKKSIYKITKELGIKDHLYHKASMLSAGEKQRVAIARALIINPSIILADEPTGSLDKKNTIEVMKHLKIFQQNGGTVLMMPHGDLADSYVPRVIRLNKGELIK